MALTITCPVCGKRNGYEFRYGGEDKGPRPEEAGMTPGILVRLRSHEQMRGRCPERVVVPQRRLRLLVYHRAGYDHKP